jgi:MoaA/NifB/PqqE/SkfB family radical SAM enzyme
MWQSRKDGDTLEIDVWKRFIDSLEDFVGPQAQIQFVGGEPLLKEGVFDLINYAAQKGFTTTMTTNGYLINEEIAQKLIDSKLTSLVLSLESLNRQTHDFIRGREGVYDRAMSAIDLLHNRNNNSLSIHIVTIIMQPNLEDIPNLVEWVNKNQAIQHLSFQAVMQPFFTPLDDQWYEREEFSMLWPKDMSKVEQVLDKLVEYKQRGYKITNPVAQFDVFRAYFRYPQMFVKKRCHLGYSSLTVNTQGKIFLCNSMESIGDIQEAKDMQELWSSKEAERVRKNIKNCTHNCKLMINCFFEEENST